MKHCLECLIYLLNRNKNLGVKEEVAKRNIFDLVARHADHARTNIGKCSPSRQ